MKRPRGPEAPARRGFGRARLLDRAGGRFAGAERAFVRIGGFVFGGHQHGIRDEACVDADRGLDPVGHVGVLLQILLGVLVNVVIFLCCLKFLKRSIARMPDDDAPLDVDPDDCSDFDVGADEIKRTVGDPSELLGEYDIYRPFDDPRDD